MGDTMLESLNMTVVLSMAVFCVGVIAYTVFFRRRQDPYDSATLVSETTVRWEKKHSDQFDGWEIARELAEVQATLWPRLLALYKVQTNCNHGNIALDPNYHKPAEMMDVDRTRNIYINPKGSYRRAYASELHNLLRYKIWGYDGVYQHQNIIDADRLIEGRRMCREHAVLV